jgi:hypothetical protein
VILMMIAVATSTASQQPGWGGPIAILIPFLLMWAATTGYRRWQEARQTTPSLPPGETPSGTVNPQVSGDSDSNDSDLGSGGAEVVPIRRKPVEDFVAANLDRKPPTQVVKEAAAATGASESTVWRAINRFRRNGGGAA